MKEINKRPESQPEKEMATHSSILAWKIQDTGDWWATVYGVARVGHDVATKPPPPESQQTMVRARQGGGCAGPQKTGPGYGISFYGAVVCKTQAGGTLGSQEGREAEGEGVKSEEAAGQSGLRALKLCFSPSGLANVYLLPGLLNF